MKKELPVNYIQHLTGFFEMVAQDNRLSMGHIALYATLFQFWNLNRFQNPVSIARSEIMLISKIGSKSTYTKLLKELDEFGYIQYLPSHNPIKGSLVNLYTFGHSTGHSTGASSGHSTGSSTGQSSGILVVPSINNIKHINNINNREVENFSKKNISSRTKSKNNENSFSKPHLEEIQNYFLEKENKPIEAERFFNHYESNGWLVGGKTKMKDWKAAARNWMLNTKRFEKPETNTSHLHVNENKRYDIPL
jgi:hypothetical protein